MQMTKGAGLSELLGMREISQKTMQKNGRYYRIIRPLLGYAKPDLLDYLDKRHITYFVDESNDDDRFRRNYFRKAYANGLIDDFKEGIRRSFEYLQEDINHFPKIEIRLEHKEYIVFKVIKGQTHRFISEYFKETKYRHFQSTNGRHFSQWR